MKYLRSYAATVVYFFAFLAILFIPGKLLLLPFQEKLADGLFGGLLTFFSESIFHFHTTYREISSDSAYFYLLLFLLLLFALLLAVVVEGKTKWMTIRTRALAGLRWIFAYYLAFQLLQYGFDKLFKGQFYMPEPNILYTPFGQMGKDILFWSTMGTSYVYNLFTGLLEVLAALLLLFKKSRHVGALLATGIMVNIVAINFGFDISVKVYSSFLLLLAFILLAPLLRSLYVLLVLRKQASLPAEPSVFNRSFPLAYKAGLKTLIFGFMAAEVFFPVIYSGNFNDDLAERPYLHGAYEVDLATVELDTLPKEAWPFKRFFIHRNGYLILQDTRDQLKDYRLQINQVSGQFHLMDDHQQRSKWSYDHREADSTLTVQFKMAGKPYRLQARGLNWRQLPALRSDFHWTIDALAD